MGALDLLKQLNMCEEYPTKSLRDEYPNIKSLCEKYRFIELKYVYSIDHAQDTLDNVMLGSQRHVYRIPHMLSRCRADLKSLRFDRARNYYDEYNNGPELDTIEEKLEAVTENLEEQSQLHDCNIENVVQTAMLRHLVQALNEH